MIQKFKSLSKVKKFLLGFFVLIVFCGFCSITSLIVADPTPTPVEQAELDVEEEPTEVVEPTLEPTETPEPTSTPVSEAPEFSVFVENEETMTDAQWENFAKEVQGLRVTNWQGTVSDVDVGEILGGHTVIVSMNGDNPYMPSVRLDVDEETALSLSKKQSITFSGIIDYASNSFGLTIQIGQVEIE